MVTQGRPRLAVDIERLVMMIVLMMPMMMMKFFYDLVQLLLFEPILTVQKSQDQSLVKQI